MDRTPPAHNPKEDNSRAGLLEHELRNVESRDLQLWSIVVLMLLVLTAGILALLAPHLLWKQGAVNLAASYLPQLFYGLISLIILFNIYALNQRQLLQRAARELSRQLGLTEAAEQLALMDPLTGTYNRRCMDQIVNKEISRADRQNTTLTLLMIDMDEFKSINTRFGHQMGDRILAEAARVMRTTFRNSDTIIRYGGDEFLIVLSDTSEAQAERAVTRLKERVADWNAANPNQGCSMQMTCGCAEYFKGAGLEELLTAADQKMLEGKQDAASAG